MQKHDNILHIPNQELLDKAYRGLLSPENRPGHDKTLFYAVLMKLPENKLTYLCMTSEDSYCLLLFTSQYRAVDYVQISLGIDIKDITLKTFSIAQCTEDAQRLKNIGFNEFVLDRCPRCGVMLPIDIDSLQKSDKLMEIWAITMAERLASYEQNISIAVQALNDGCIFDAYTVLMQITEHIDKERLEVYELMGTCGVITNDSALVEQAFENMTRWMGKQVS